MPINFFILITLDIPGYLILAKSDGSDRRISDHIDFFEFEGINRDVLE